MGRRYRQILQEEVQEELEHLNKLLEMYEDIEKDIPDDQLCNLVVEKYPGYLSDFYGVRLKRRSEVIRARIRILMEGESVEDLEEILEGAKRAYKMFKMWEENLPEDERYLAMQPFHFSKLPDKVVPVEIKPATELLKREIRKLEAKIADINDITFVNRVGDWIRRRIFRKPINNYPDSLFHGFLTQREIEKSKGIAGYRRDLGHAVRSAWEANYARYLISQGVDYLYEPQGFELEVPDMFRKVVNGKQTTIYIPDFWFKNTNVYVELKGSWYRFNGEVALSKIILFRHQNPELELRVIGENEYKEIERKFKDKINDNPKFCGWECYGDNLVTNPKKFG